MKLILAAILALSILDQSVSQFNKQYVGVAYSPYTKYFEGTSTPYWNSYSIDDIKQQLNVISTKFSMLSTYSMGVNQWNVNSAWDQADSNCIIPRAAAQLNKAAGSLRFTVNQGVIQNGDAAQQAAEIRNAFSAAQDANTIFPGTVTGITFTNEYLTDANNGNQILSMIQNNKNKGVKVGTRIHTCGAIYDKNSPIYNSLVSIIKASDFIYCNVYPDSGSANQGYVQAASAVMNAFFGFRYQFQLIKPNIEVGIGETGWPSSGVSFNNSPNTVQNLQNYWTEIARWASDTKVNIQMFEAIDEPWKSDVNNQDPNSPSGKFGGEGHYGWWYMRDNNKPHVYIEKSTGKQIS